MLGSAQYQASQQGGHAQWANQGFGGNINPEDLFRKIFEEFSGGGSGRSSGFEEFHEYAPVEVHG